MKLTLTETRVSLLATIVGCGVWLQPVAHAIEFGFSSIPGAEIALVPNGDGTAKIEFNTTHPELYSFQIDAVVGGTGSALGYYGDFIPSFEIGPVSLVNGSFPIVETAPIEGLGLLSLYDNSGNGGGAFFGPPSEASSLYTASVSAVGLAFLDAEPRLYTTTDPDLVEFFSGNQFTVTIAFSFGPGVTLEDLVLRGGSSSFYGVMTSRTVKPPGGVNVPDSGSTLALGGLGLLGLLFARRRFSPGR